MPQPFLPQPVLEQALPPLHRAVCSGGAVVMPINTNTDSGPVGAITDLRNLMTGEHMLAAAGFADVRVLDLPGGTVLSAPHLSSPPYRPLGDCWTYLSSAIGRLGRASS